MRKEVFVIPEFAQYDIEEVWGKGLRKNEMETVLELYNLAKEMGLVVMSEIEFNQAVLNISLSGAKGVSVSNGSHMFDRVINYTAPQEVSA